MKLSLILFILVALAQLYVPAHMILRQETVLKKGKEYKFKTQPIDPTDPFRGAYIWLTFEENSYKIDSATGWQRGERVFVQLNDSMGFAGVAGLLKSKPEGENFLEATIDYISYYNKDSAIIYIDYPFNRFYMDEYKSKPAEKIYFESSGDTTKTTYAIVNILNGRAVLKDVMIDGEPIREIVKKRINE